MDRGLDTKNTLIENDSVLKEFSEGCGQCKIIE
jgi:hypothetical protein